MPKSKKKKKTIPIDTPKRGRGRPRTIPRELVISKVCKIIARSNKCLNTAIKEVNKELNQRIDVGMIFDWLDNSPELTKQYARAKEEQADYLVDEMLNIADDSSEDEIFIEADTKDGKSAKRVANNEFVQRSRLRVDTRKWIASKLKPKRYGDKIDLNPSGPVEVRVTVVYEDGAAI